jgi:hypothetical protein
VPDGDGLPGGEGSAGGEGAPAGEEAMTGDSLDSREYELELQRIANDGRAPSGRSLPS